MRVNNQNKQQQRNEDDKRNAAANDDEIERYDLSKNDRPQYNPRKVIFKSHYD